jgi:hypothetical protein
MNDQTVVEVVRDLAADPVSAALLLTSSTALEWWPGLRLERGTGEGGAMPVTLTSGRQSELVGIEALPPQRTATAFVARFRVSGGSYGTTDGAVSPVEMGRNAGRAHIDDAAT